MGVPKVKFNIKQGMGRPKAGYDHYSMMLAYYKDAAAVGAYAAIGNKQYLSLTDAEADGVVDTCAEATAAATTANAITAIGANGDTITLTIPDYDGTVITIGTFAKTAAESTVTLLATALVADINAKTYSTGYSATVGAAGAYTLTAPKNRGIYPNTKSATVTIVGTITHTNSAFAGGTKSRLAMWHYQIERFFARNPQGKLYFSPIWDDTANTATQFETQLKADIAAKQNAYALLDSKAAGCRQFLVNSPERAFALTTMTAIQVAINTLFDVYIPAVAWYVSNTSGAALSAFANTRTLTAGGVSALITQSSTGGGLYQYSCQSTVFGHGGEALGTESAASVSGSVGEVQLFNIADDLTENEKIMFMDSAFTDYQTLAGTTGGTNLIDQICDYGYVFARKIPNVTGTYWVEGNAAIDISDDYAHRETTRTVQKVVRNFYAAIVTLLNAKNKLNKDGTLSDQAKANYLDRGTPPLRQMATEEDLSQDPSQNDGIIVSDLPIVAGKIPITLKLIPITIGREIDVDVQFVAKI